MRIISNIVLFIGLLLLPDFARAQAATGRSPAPMLIDSSNPWELVHPEAGRDSIFALAVSPQGLLFESTTGVVFMSSDNGSTWEVTGHLGVKTVDSFAFDSDGILYVATRRDGVHRSEGGEFHFQAVNDGLETLRIGEVAADSSGNVYASAVLGGVYRLLDDGETWEKVNDNGLDNPFVPSLAVNADGVVFHGSDGGVFRSFDEGATWEAVNTGLGNLLVEELVVSRDDVLFAGTDGGVYRTLNNGDSWEAVHDTTFGGRPVRALANNDNFALFAGTHGGGVFRSLNHGASWEPVNDGLDVMDVSSLVVGSDGSLFAGTFGGGLYKRDATTDVSADEEFSIPTEFELIGNYPNPFNPTTLIQYALPVQSGVELAVFDAAGRKVAMLVNEEQAAGRHEVAFEAANLPSGIYFYRLYAGSFSEVKPMVLLR